jgi:hypothetical protein
VPVTSSDPSVGTITVSPVSFSGGESFVDTAFDPVGEGTVEISVTQPTGFSVPNNLPTTVTGTVTAPAATVGNATVGWNLQQLVSVSLAASPPSPVDVTVTIDDDTVALLSDSATAAGGSSITFLGVTSASVGTFFVQGLTEGSATMTVTADGYSSGTGSVDVWPSGFYISNPAATFSTNTFAANTLVRVWSVRLQPGTLNYSTIQALRGGFSADVPVTSSDPSVGTITVSPITFSGGGNSFIDTAFDPVGEGTADISVTQPSGFQVPNNLPTTVTGTVTAPAATVASATVGENLQQLVTVSLAATPPAPVDVTVTIDDDAVALLSTNATAAGSNSVTFPGVTSASVGSFYVQGLAQGSATMTVTATGYSTGTGSVDVWPSGFYISNPAATFTTNTFAANVLVRVWSVRLNPANLNYSTTQPLRGGFTVGVPVTSSDPSVGTITVSPVTFSGNDSWIDTAFDPLALGTTDISITQPTGFTAPNDLPTTVTGTVTAPTISMADAVVGVDLQQGIGVSLGAVPPSPVDVTVTVSSGAIATLSTDPTVEGSTSVTFTGVSAQSVGSVYVQGRSLGNTVITVQAAGYSDDTSSVTVNPSGFYISNPASAFSVDEAAGNTLVRVWSVRLNPTTLNYSTTQPLRGGLSVDVPVTSSDPSVGTITVSPITFTANQSFGDSAFDPLAPGTTDISITQPAGFSPPSNLATTVTATVTGGVALLRPGTTSLALAAPPAEGAPWTLPLAALAGLPVDVSPGTRARLLSRLGPSAAQAPWGRVRPG